MHRWRAGWPLWAAPILATNLIGIVMNYEAFRSQVEVLEFALIATRRAAKVSGVDIAATA